MDVALDSWQQNHERLNKTALQLHASDHPRAKDTFDVLEDSEKQMLKNSAEVPKTENESQSNLEKIKEYFQKECINQEKYKIPVVKTYVFPMESIPKSLFSFEYKIF